MPNLFTLERKYVTNPLINDIRDWLNLWSPSEFRKCNEKMINPHLDFNRYLTNIIFWIAGDPHTAAEALLMLLESSPEPTTSPMEEECLYAESFDKCCEIIKVLSGPKKNTFLYICMFLNELLKHNQQNRLESIKLGNIQNSIPWILIQFKLLLQFHVYFFLSFFSSFSHNIWACYVGWSWKFVEIHISIIIGERTRRSTNNFHA